MRYLDPLGALNNTNWTQVYDAIAAECLRQEIYINLDNHISEGKWCCGGEDGNTWYDCVDLNETT